MTLSLTSSKIIKNWKLCTKLKQEVHKNLFCILLPCRDYGLFCLNIFSTFFLYLLKSWNVYSVYIFSTNCCSFFTIHLSTVNIDLKSISYFYCLTILWFVNSSFFISNRFLYKTFIVIFFISYRNSFLIKNTNCFKILTNSPSSFKRIISFID